MRRVNVRKASIGGRRIDELPVFTDAATGRPFLLPLLFTTFVVRNGFVFRQRTSRYSDPHFEESYLTKKTMENYFSALHLFLESLQDYSASYSDQRSRANADQLHLVDQRFISIYLNEYLPPRFGSVKTLRLHQASIQSFFDWLSRFGFVEGLEATLRNDVHDRLGTSRKDKSSVVQYIPRNLRQELLQHCRTERDRLILRAGYELGLRAAENRGLILEDQHIRSTRKPGLIQLFNKSVENPDATAFEYWLNGRYCKGGKSRPILIPRRLLNAMRVFFEGERKSALEKRTASSDHLFVNYSRNAKVEISEQYPTDLFRSLRGEVQNLDPKLSYHDLRHTFGTELFASLVGPEGSGRSEQRALAIVQDRLGHSSAQSTLVYVHLFAQMQLAERPDIVV